MQQSTSIRAPNIPVGAVISDFLGLQADGNTKSLRRFSRESVLGGLDALTAAMQAGGGIVFATRALALAALAYNVNQMAWVVLDPVANNNGVYQKIGASGVGTWVRVADLPYSFYRAIADAEESSANAILATNDKPIASQNALVVVNAVADNTSNAVTVAFNGGPQLRVKTNGGNDPAIGGIKANMLLAGYIDNATATFRLLSDQASSAIQIAAETAAAGAAAAKTAAEAARDLAVQAADLAATVGAGDIPTTPSIALAKLSNFIVNRKYLIVSGFNDIGDAPPAIFVRVAAAPAHGASFRSADRFMPDGSTDAAHGGYWEYARSQELMLEYLGRLEVDAATDTATLNAWAGALASGYKPAPAPAKSLKVNGQVAFTNLPAGTVLDFRKLKLSQQQRFVQMIYFNATNASPTVIGGTYRGYAALELSLDPNTRPSEYCYDATRGPFDPAHPDATYNPESGAFIGVSAITAEGCGKLTVLGGDYQGFSGVGIYALNCSTTIRDVDSRGLGPRWVVAGNQGAHMFAFASWSGTDHVDWDRVHDWTGFDCDGWGFCGLVAACRFICHSHRYLRALSQHIWYVIEADYVQIHSFHVAGAPLHGVKITYDNYAGRFGGVLYANGLNATPGFLVRRSPQKDLWEATATFATVDFDTELGAGKWKVSPLMQRRGGVIHDITAENCGYAVSGVVNSNDYANNEYVEGMIIHDIKVRNGTVGMHLERFGKNTLVHSCDIDTVTASGIELVDFAGTIRDLRIANAGKNGISGYLADDTVIEHVRFENCGLAGATTDEKIPIYITNRDAGTSRPSANATPALRVRDCAINYTAGNAPVNQLMLLDTSIQATVEGLRTTDAQATLNVTGTLVRGRFNERPFTSGAQNLPNIDLGPFAAITAFDPATAGTSEFRGAIATIIQTLQAFHLFNADPNP